MPDLTLSLFLTNTDYGDVMPRVVGMFMMLLGGLIANMAAALDFNYYRYSVLALTPQGNVRYTLKTPYRDGTTHIILEPLDFIARLAALVPKPRVNLTRFHGVFAPNSALRHHVTPAGCGQRKPLEAKTPVQRRAAMTPDQVRGRLWAQRLKRVFKIDIETCEHCGGAVKVIACIEDPAVVKRILDHLEQRPESNATRTHPARAPPRPAAKILPRKCLLAASDVGYHPYPFPA